eukprot:gnl/TRDRNA2_/TRDRNA2_81999_c0_seq1.p1 gnl/TRDRNA2_/TRDRNA2_81999_c0~~gnl/TRDRNA2_/TRDRNA2_81999_c0_seq1.p1  ORF type:complete len:217 (+),score=26.11 gnl/TRDRNA2_/TRDRNA2_81999_c0_seq1:33-653(+)
MATQVPDVVGTHWEVVSIPVPILSADDMDDWVLVDTAVQASVKTELDQQGGSLGLDCLTVGLFGCEFYDKIREYYEIGMGVYQLADKLTKTLGSIGAAGAWTEVECANTCQTGVLFAALMPHVRLSDVSLRRIFSSFFEYQRDLTVSKAFAELGLREDVIPEQIRKRYLQLACSHHPANNDEHERFVRVNCAYELLRAFWLADRKA